MSAYSRPILLADRGDLDELRSLSATDLQFAGSRLAELLGERGDLDGLRARADTGDGYAADQLARLLANRGEIDELRARGRRLEVCRPAIGQPAG